MITLFNWFFASGDSEFFYVEKLRDLTFFPDVWKGQEGLGVSSLQYLWLDYPYRLINFLLSRLGFSWFVIDKLWWILVFSLAIFSAYKLMSLVPIPKFFKGIGSLIYATNTYILLLFDGGQLGVALCYSVIPFVLYATYQYLTSHKIAIKESIKCGLLLAITLFLDIRIFYIFTLLITFLVIILIFNKKFIFSKNYLIIPFIIMCINSFWLLPSIQYKDSLSTFVTNTTTTDSGLRYFSVANFTDSLSLLHPNYPDNIFGYVYFFKPEFLIIPIIGFAILFGTLSWVTILFTLIGLVGAFLAKGVQQPFGEVYTFLYTYFPGFFLFRDPTKWYILTAISYTILIPQTISLIATKFKGKQYFILALFLLFWIFSLRYIFIGKVRGNVTPAVLTQDYKNLKNVLIEDSVLGRTVWLPTIERFEYSSDIHPAVSGGSIFSESSASGITKLLDDELTLTKISSIGGRYIIVPEDIDKKIFLDSYTFNEDLRTDLIKKLDSKISLQRMSGFKRLAVYKNMNAQSLFSTQYSKVEAIPERYDTWKISLPDRETEDTLRTLISYDPNWRLSINGVGLNPVLDNGFMNFALPRGHNNLVSLEYLPTKTAKIGAIFSLISLTAFVLILFI